MSTRAGGIWPMKLSVLLIAGLFFSSLNAEAGTFYVSPEGDDGNPGTLERPWRTPEKASSVAAGDTVIFLPGEYPGQLRPENSGTERAPVTFRASERRETLLSGGRGIDYTVHISGLSHLRIEGLHITHREGERWLKVEDSSHIDITDCLLEDEKVNRRWVAARISNCQQVRLRGNVFRRVHGDMLWIENDSRHVLLEGNSISKAGHSPFSTRGGVSCLVLRGNVFHAGWGRAWSASVGTRNLLFENNILTNSLDSGRSAGSQSQPHFKTGIFRFNRVFRNWGKAIMANPWRDDLFFSEVRIYNNVFDDNFAESMYLGTDRHTVGDVVFANNIFSRSNRWADSCQISLQGGYPEKARFLNNVIVGDEPGGLTVIRELPFRQRTGLSVVRAQSDEWAARHGRRYEGNLDVMPGYADPEKYNHALAAGSPLRSAGMHLTRAAGSGSGTKLAVEDSLYFYDGFGIKGELGDIIAVGSPRRTARITAIDRESDTLTLDRALRWSDGDPVSLPWGGSAPDIGVYEHGSGGRPSVQVAAEPFMAEPGEEVRLSVVARGNIRVRRVTWQLGDGTAAEGAEVVHSYRDEYDYPVRAYVVDADGNEHIGTGYVVVERPGGPGDPLLHTTFDRDDEEWWWRWQTYRPRRGQTKWERVLDSRSGQGYMRVEAPEDGAMMPCWTMPPGWDVDRFPVVRIRYRVGEGTPAALYLRAFGTIANVHRKAYVALAPAAEIPYSVFPGDRLAAEHVLHDDGQWHELEFDARLVRDLFPDVKMLEALRMDAAWRGRDAREGHWFEVDEVYIGP